MRHMPRSSAPGQRRAVQPSIQLGTPHQAKARGSRQGGRGRNDVFNDHHDRRMEHIASVSRSSGLEKDGDLLKESVVQEEFRTFIDKKLRIFWDLYGPSSPTQPAIDSSSTVLQRQKKDNQENILILFRKLREGLFASDRKDAFALEVYETSLYLSVVFDSPVQTTSILSRLPSIYSTSLAPQPFRLATILVLLLHHLAISFPSQQIYWEQIGCLIPDLLERPSATYLWISALARSLRTSNFVRFDKLSYPDAFEHLLPLSPPISSSDVKAPTILYDLPRRAVHALVSRLRVKARDTAWRVFRNAYRELSSADETRVWLGKGLFFDSFGCEATVVRFDEWVRERCQEGQLRPKEGVEGRWMVCKAR